MSHLLQFLTCLVLVGLCTCRHGSNAEEGDPCTPRRARTCGDRKLIDETVTELSEDDGYG